MLTTHWLSRRAALAVAGLGAALLAAGTAGATTQATPPYQATTAEVNTALGAAQIEAWTTSVVARGAPATVPARVQDAFTRGVGLAAGEAAKTSAGWPSDVHSVRYSSMTRATALKYMDGSTTDSDQNVVVVQLAGDFAVTTSGPGNAVATGTTETIVVDPATGNVIDFGLTTSPILLPNPVVAFG